MNIQWLNFLFFVLLTMPGAFINFLKKIPVFRYNTSGNLYLFILFIYILFFSFLSNNYYLITLIFSIALVLVLPLIIELKIWKFSSVKNRVLRIIFNNSSLFIFPILEELNYRWLIYNVGQKLDITCFSYIIISSLAFGISHIPYLGNKSIYKIIQGFLLAFIFLKFGVLSSILCHALFNIFVYVYRIEMKERV